MRAVISLCAALGICLTPLVVSAQTPTCESCLPAEMAPTTWSGELDVCFQYQTFSAEQRTWIEQGVDLIENWLEGNSVNVSFSFRIGINENDCNDADVKVRAEPNISTGGPSRRCRPERNSL
jgi:hypothetical protein